ncbi:transglycosylase domain-containing protein [bacterium]|nr:transglycosylase domain-containing protein [bacterium]
MLRWLAAALIAWFALCVGGLVYLRFFPPLLTALQLQRWIEHGDVPGSASGFVPLPRLGPHLPHAVVAAEDARFYEHGGVDWRGMREAAADNWERGRLWRGGSTITQQLVKNLFFPTFGSLPRKILEIPLSLLAELILSKPRILELYLNVIEWGPGIYGGEDAAQHYYQVPAAFLSRGQAARLAAVLPAPRSRRPQHMNAYSAKILGRMAAVGW